MRFGHENITGVLKVKSKIFQQTVNSATTIVHK